MSDITPFSRPKPSLALLPPELKALIVEMVDEVDEEEEEDFEDDLEVEDVDDEAEVAAHDCSTHPPGAHGHEHADEHEHAHEHAEGGGCCGGEMVPSALSMLALVNTEFATLAAPFLWKVRSYVPRSRRRTNLSSQSVDFTERNNLDVAYFITDILPRHASHVQELTVALAEGFYFRSDQELSAVTSLVGPAYDASHVEASSPEEEVADQQAKHRRMLFAHLLPLLPKLESLDFDLVDTPAESEPRNEVTLALLASRPALLDLTLTSADDALIDESYLAALLAPFPLLERLDLAIDNLLPSATGRTELIQTLVGLEHLETLSLAHTPFVGKEFAEAEWKAPLKILALAECDEVSVPDFRKLVSKFGETLEVLDLEVRFSLSSFPRALMGAQMTPHDNVDKDNLTISLPLPLPHLTTLVLSTLHPSPILHSFSLSPLHEFEFGFCPKIPYADLLSFLSARIGTLERVRVTGDSSLTEGQVESLEVWCFAKGVECRVMPTEEGEGDGWEEEEDEEEESEEESE